MRIRFLHTFFHPDKSSVAQLLGDVAFSLASNGHDVEVVATRGSYGGDGRALPRREIIEGVHVSRIWSPNLGKGNLLARLADLGTYTTGSVAHALGASRADKLVVFTHPPLFASVAPIIQRLRGEPYIVVMMDLYPHIAVRSGMLRENSLPVRLANAMNVATLGRAERVIVIGACMAREVAALGVPEEKIAVIQNWVDDMSILPIPRSENVLRAELGLRDAFVVMYSGNMGLGHCFDDILAAARSLKHRNDIRFVFVGDGMRRGEIAAARDRDGLKNVILMDYVSRERLRYSLPLADAHFVSLRPGFEGLMVPSKAYGAMAAGRPLLYQGSSRGEVARMLAEEGGGLVFEEGEEGRLTQVISAWADDRRVPETHGSRGRDLIKAKYSKVRALEAYERVIAG